MYNLKKIIEKLENYYKKRSSDEKIPVFMLTLVSWFS